VGGVPDVIEGRTEFRPAAGSFVPGFGKTEEVLTRGNRVSPGVTGAELNVVGKLLFHDHKKYVVVGCARILFGALVGEKRIGALTIVEVALVRGIGDQWRCVQIALAEQSKAKLPNVLNPELQGVG